MEGTTAFASSTVSGHKLPITHTWHSPAYKHQEQWRIWLISRSKHKNKYFISMKNFSILVIQVNLNRIEMWPDNKVVEILYIWWHTSKWEKEEAQSKEQRKQKPKLRNRFNKSNSQRHVQSPNMYGIHQLPNPLWLHQLPTVGGDQFHTLTNLLSFCDRPAVAGKLRHWCWLAQQNQKEKENSKETKKKRDNERETKPKVKRKHKPKTRKEEGERKEQDG
jgi:hypothetical protein